MNDQHPKLVIDSQLARRQLAQEFTSRVDLDRKRRNSIKQPSNGKRDMSGFSFVLILMLLCEIAASQTDNPVFWLLVGPTPLALALASSRLFRYSRYRSRRGIRGSFLSKTRSKKLIMKMAPYLLQSLALVRARVLTPRSYPVKNRRDAYSTLVPDRGKVA